MHKLFDSKIHNPGTYLTFALLGWFRLYYSLQASFSYFWGCAWSFTISMVFFLLNLHFFWTYTHAWSMLNSMDAKIYPEKRTTQSSPNCWKPSGVALHCFFFIRIWFLFLFAILPSRFWERFLICKNIAVLSLV